MRDYDLELMFERVGGDTRPDAEFEEDLLFRLSEHVRNTSDVGGPAARSSAALKAAADLARNVGNPCGLG